MHTAIPPRQKTSEPSQGWIDQTGAGAGGGRLVDPDEVESAIDSSTPQAVCRLSNEFIGRSKAMRGVLNQIEIVAPTDAGVLILGETGTGKELVARAVHQLSRRSCGTLAKINCAAIPSGLLESELFGHEKGSFTGAINRRIGRFEIADKGSLFLDEIGDFPAELQPKLLRVLQEKEFEKVGSNRTQPLDVRVIAATSRNLEQMVVDREFRSDLFYRLNVFPIRIPPLRERCSDIPLLVWHFVEYFAARMSKEIRTIQPEAMEALKSYHWPGNIRELQNFIERAVILSPKSILQVTLEDLERSANLCATPQLSSTGRTASLEELERGHIIKALEQTKWLVGGPNGAAALLRIKRTTLLSRMQKLGIYRRAHF